MAVVLTVLIAILVSVNSSEGNVLNLAINKSCSMSSTYQDQNKASAAVDGNTTSFMHTGVGETFAWWKVDLVTEVHDPLVKLHFRTDNKQRRNGVQLYTSQTPFSSYPGGQLCHEVTGKADGTDIPDVVSVYCKGIWQYLMVYTKTQNKPSKLLMDFAELQVLVCTNGTYGAYCTQECISRNCETSSQSCDRNGTCSKGCQAGWEGTDCRQACSGTTYGHNCSKYCVERNCKSDSETCSNVSTGLCPDGCSDGWTGVDCLQNCTAGMYGPHCSLSCSDRHCLTTEYACPHDSGLCSGGCQPGWNGTDCALECKTTYGTNCSQRCADRHCLLSSSPCDHVTGNCEGECQAGWEGANCTQECSSGTYGPGCTGNCSARHCVTSSLNSSSCNGTHGQCTGGCMDGWKGMDCTTDNAKLSQAAASAAFLSLPVLIAMTGGGFLFILLAASLLIVLSKRRRRRAPVKENKGNATEGFVVPEVGAGAANTAPYVDDDEEDEEEVLDVKEVPERVYCNFSKVNVIGEIPLSDLETTILRVKAMDDGFEAEFDRLETGFSAAYGVSQKPENSGKNRFKGYYPYDHNRVCLSPLPDIPGSDYINASIMHSYNKRKTYIAAQAPKKKTVGDFWRMIWEQQCDAIIMLTGLVEEGKDNVQRLVVQYHYTSWPDHGVPDTLALVNFIWMVRMKDAIRDGPLLVHCSAGIGRTGTYIAVDSLLDQAREEGVVDVPGYVCVMREQRKGMVQTKEQYQCVFECLLEMTKFGNTSMDVENFTTSYNSRGMDSMVDRKTLREITQFTIDEVYLAKPNSNRLWVDGNQDFVVRLGSTLRNLQGYLQTVCPSPGQEKLLWKLVEENNVHNIFVVSALETKLVGDKGSCAKHGAYTIETTSRTTHESGLVVYRLRFKCTGTTESRDVTLFQQDGAPTMAKLASALLNHPLLMYIAGEITPTVVIHSEPHEKYSALFCIMANILTGIILDRAVDVIRHMRVVLRNCNNITFSLSEIEMLCKYAEKCVEATDSKTTYANT